MIRVQVKEKRFGDTPVLGPISLSLQPDSVTAITGPSGVGKTTLLRIIAGLDQGFVGTVEGVTRVGVVFQEPTLLPWRSVAQNVTLAAGVSEAEAEVALADVGLAGRGGDWPRNLSLGQQRRVSLARALALEPELLILDEPFASLDGETRDRMLDLLRRAITRRNMATLIVTHTVEEAIALGARVLRLEGCPAVLDEGQS